MSADKVRPAAERQIARIALAGERDYVAAALAFIHELADRVGLEILAYVVQAMKDSSSDA